MSSLGYKNRNVLLAGAVFIACALWLWFMGDSVGRRPLKVDGEFTWFGWIIFGLNLWVVAMGLPHIFHIVTSKPALEVGEGELKIWMLPYETIAIASILKIEITNTFAYIYREGKARRRINTALLNEPRDFFFGEVNSCFENKNIVVEA